MSETTSNKLGKSSFLKAWNAFSMVQRKTMRQWFLIILAIIGLGGAYVVGTIVGISYVKVPVVLQREEQALIVGQGDNFFVVANTTTPLPNSTSIMPSNATQLLWNWTTALYGKVSGYCTDVDLEVTFWVGQEHTAEKKFCVKPNSYIIMSPQGNSYWDGVRVNGFTTSTNWVQFTVPAYYAPKPETTSTSAPRKTPTK